MRLRLNKPKVSKRVIKNAVERVIDALEKEYEWADLDIDFNEFLECVLQELHRDK